MCSIFLNAKNALEIKQNKLSLRYCANLKTLSKFTKRNAVFPPNQPYSSVEKVNLERFCSMILILVPRNIYVRGQ